MKKYALFMLMLAAGPAFSAAGKALFVSGTVTAEGARPRAIAAGTELDVGDIIVTAARSRAQLAMNDGQRYALRAGTRFRIDAFSQLPAVRSGAQATAVAADGQSFFTLQKGGFRAVSGAIGKKDPAAYEVRTPVGTLGIRGTVWAAVFCRDDCDDAPGLTPGQPIRNGLYLGVDQGRIRFAGRGLELELNAGEFAFIPLDEVPIERLREPPAFLRGDGAGALEVAGSGSRSPAQALAKPADFSIRRSPLALREAVQIEPQPGSGDPVNQDINGVGPRGAAVKLTGGNTPTVRSLAYGYGGGQAPLVNAGSTLAALLLLDGNGNLVGFTTPNGTVQSFAIGTASQANLGSSAATGIRWGRWTGGNATLATPGAATQTLNLSQQSLPWIAGAESAAAIAVPISGARTYVLAGGTNPTDAAGTVGALGAAFLAADFTNRKVTATLSLDIANRNWWATGTAPIAGGGSVFSGNFSDVRINGVTGNTGALAGFLTEAQSGAATANGAGFGYWLLDATGQQSVVTGVVALREGQGAPPPPPLPANRYVSYVVGNFTPAPRGGVFGGTQSNVLTQYLLNAGSSPTRFSAPDLSGASATYDLNTSAVINSGFDAGTGLRWGRWAGGSALVAGNQPLDLSAQSLHWILGPAYAGAPVLPQAGSGYLALAGGTLPTDTRGNVGAPGGASLFVDFTNLNLAFALVANIDGRNWYASGQTRLTANNLQFSDVLVGGNIGNIASVAGVFGGFLVLPAAGGPANLGVGVNWALDSQVAAVGAVTGADVFTSAGSGYPNGAGNALPPPAPQRRDIAFSNAAVPGAVALSNAAGNYTLAGFDLTRLRGQFNFGQGPAVAQFDIGTAANQEQGFDLRGMLRWGRWSGGTGTVTVPPGGGNPVALDLAAHSLHWISSADSANAPVLPAAGVANYTWVGGTSPTNQNDEAGVLNAASFTADFTNATVAASVQASFSKSVWAGAGNGNIGAGTNLFNGILAGTYTNTASGQVLPASGSFTGFFTGPQDAVGNPQGVGLSFEMAEPQTQTSVNGVAGFVYRSAFVP